MSFDEEQQRKSRVVVETPNARREVVQTQTTRTPEKSGFSTGMVAAVALVAMAAVAIIFLFLNSRGDDATDNTNVSVLTQPTPAVQPTIIIQQAPATQPTPIIIQQAPSTMSQPAPVVITQPPPMSPAPAAAPDDSTLMTNVEQEFSNDTEIAATDVAATVTKGKVTLDGTVATPELRKRVEKMAYAVKGVRSVENKIKVSSAASLIP
ncbi:MAG: BON domain-containing protein [Pyrinomonadaceae bacterium]|nr:BON domain-containing protein [Pyrinomonadaceae bacterium]